MCRRIAFDKYFQMDVSITRFSLSEFESCLFLTWRLIVSIERACSVEKWYSSGSQLPLDRI